MGDIVSRKEALKQGSKRYFTGNPCKRGHVVERYVSCARCIECHCLQTNKHRVNNLNKYKEYRHKSYIANPEKGREQARKNRKTPLGQLRTFCANAARDLVLGRIEHSRLILLNYKSVEFIAHLESTLPEGMTFSDARAVGYHIDHITPLSLISASLPADRAGRIQAFQIAQRLENLQMIPGIENLSKGSSVS